MDNARLPLHSRQLDINPNLRIMHDSHSNPDTNISEATSATLVPSLFTNEKQPGDGSQSSSTVRLPQAVSTENVQNGNKSKIGKSSRLLGLSFGPNLVPPLSFRRPSRPACLSQHLNFCQAPTSTDTQEQLAIVGYRQELHRSWDFWSLFAMSFCNVSVMLGSFEALQLSYQYWGPILMTVGSLATSCLMVGLNTVFAEMASAYPVAGAMFTWTFKLARTISWLRDWARPLSWVIGFFLFASHLMVQIEGASCFVAVLTTALAHSGLEWVPTDIQAKTIGVAFIALCGLISITPLGRSPLVWKFLGVLTVLLNLSACIVLRTTANHQGNISTLFKVSPKYYPSLTKGYIMLRGWALATVIVGSEPAAHMAEETKNPASTVPRAMFYNAIFCGFWQLFCNVFVTLAITPLRPAPPSPPNTLSTISHIFWRCPLPAAQYVTATILIASFFANIAQFLGTSRFFWALARDKALPFAKFWRKVTEDRRPVRATCLMIMLSIILMFVSLEPSGWILRLGKDSTSVLVLTSYVIPCIIYLFCERGVYDQDGRNVWRLKSFSKPLTLISVLFLLLLLACYSGPAGYPLTSKTFPIAPLAALGCLMISLVFWFTYGRNHFIGPIKSLSTWSVGFEIDLPKKRSRNLAPQARADTRDPTVAQAGSQSVNDRSGAVLSSQPNHTLGIPHTYCTYGSDGSLWTETEN
ncbi:hypothetical protein PtB15_11B693 [Puccinia triticina]|nr:hypothetical protein PtB15_11B693 [Puccinia triticina]